MNRTKYCVVMRKRNCVSWSACSDDRGNRRLTNDMFATIKDAEDWIKEKYDNPWIDHIIEGSNGHLMDIEAWKESCDGGGFYDDDGFGDLVDSEYTMLNFMINPSDYTSKEVAIPDEAKYILWYNK